MVGTASLGSRHAFQPSLVFKGARPGFVFTRGGLGQGYYPDEGHISGTPSQPKEAAAPAPQV